MQGALERVLFVSGDVGGARALIPVIQEFEKQGLPFGVVAHGFIVHDAPVRWPMVSLPVEPSDVLINAVLTETGAGGVVFGSSVHDTLPLTVARQARKRNIPVVHLLDNWTGYRYRLEHDGLPMFLPDLYTVMDEVAYEGAVAAGIERSILRIAGQPALASIGSEIDAADEERPLPVIPYRLVFVSEPVTADQGGDALSPYFRGYTESQVLRLLCEVLQPYADEVILSILPHPREDVEQLRKTWEESRGRLHGALITDGKGRQHVLRADAVAGMASLLLYEAWLAGRPVLSVQPDLRVRDLRMLAGRSGVFFVDSKDAIQGAIGKWLSMMQHARQSILRSEIARHRCAAEMICSLVKEMLRDH